MSKYLCLMTALLCTVAAAPAKVVDRIVAQVNDDIITLSDLNREMAAVRQDLSSKFTGQQLETEAKKAEKEVLDELIRRKLLLQKANELGFAANVDSQVSAAIEEIRKKNSIRDMQEFERALAQQGMTLSGFREQLKQNMIVQGLVSEFVGSRITLLSQEIEKYYKNHSEQFSVPEEVTLSEIIVPAEPSADEAEARANGILKRISQGESFATLASQYSKGPTANKGGSIGNYQTAKLNPEIARAIEPVKEGETTAVLNTKEGFVIYRVDSRRPKTIRPLDEVRNDIRNQIYQQKFNPEYERFISQLREDAYIQVFDEGK